MGRRRSDNPFTILILGILSVAFFGGVIVFLGENRPILRLKPLLEREYQTPDFSTRFVPLREGGPHILVGVPQTLGEDPERLVYVGIYALKKYLQLAEGSRVEACHLRVHGRPDLTRIVTLQLIDNLRLANARTSLLGSRLRRLGVRRALVRVEGPTERAARLRVRGEVRRGRAAEAIAERALQMLVAEPYVGHVIVELQDGKDGVRKEGGREAPPAAPGPTATPAPSPTPTASPTPAGPR